MKKRKYRWQEKKRKLGEKKQSTRVKAITREEFIRMIIAEMRSGRRKRKEKKKKESDRSI